MSRLHGWVQCIGHTKVQRGERAGIVMAMPSACTDIATLDVRHFGAVALKHDPRLLRGMRLDR